MRDIDHHMCIYFNRIIQRRSLFILLPGAIFCYRICFLKKKRMKNKYRKQNGICFISGKRNSVYAMAFCFIGCLFILQLYAYIQHKADIDGYSRIHLNPHPLISELERIEEDIVRMPVPIGRRSPRAAKRRPKRTTTLIDEFLDESSQIRGVFFPNDKMTVDPMKDSGNDSFYYYPGRIWLDTDGNPIHAHGGGILHDKSGLYYWYGEYKDGPTYHAHKGGTARVDVIGVGCYSSKDLWTWKNEGIVLRAEETDESHDLHKSKVVERPKVIFNAKTGKYVMWMHVDNANYTKAAVGVATSRYPAGPFDYLYSRRPHGCESRDMTVFKDEDGLAYLVYSSADNSELHVSPLTEDYLEVSPEMRRILVGLYREAPSVFKHLGTYYMITSGCTGWGPNEALVHAAEAVMGPWEMVNNPCVGGSQVHRMSTFFAQGTFVLPVPGHLGLFIFMADRWNVGDLKESRYVWLPLVVKGAADWPLDDRFGFPLWSRVSVYWHRMWRLPPLGYI